MPPITLSRVIALLTLVAAFVLALVGKLDVLEAVLFCALSVAFLVP